MGVLTDRPPVPIDPQYKPSKHIEKLPINAPIEKLEEILDRDGGLILTNLLTPQQLSQIEAETAPWTGDQAGTSEGFPNLFPKETQLVGGLVGKSPTMTALCEHPQLVELRKRLLTDDGIRPMEDSEYGYHVDPLLSISMSFRVRYGAQRQRLHRDDAVHLIDHSRPFELRRVSQFGCLIAACETTQANGATMFIPGSHRWDTQRLPKLDEITFAEMEPGSALIFLAGAYHGAGHNSVPDFTRVVHGLFFCRGTYRTEENQFLAIPRSKVSSMSPMMQQLLGYKQPGIALGLYENGDPMRDLQATLAAANA